jgi:hypothetical protein
VSVRAVLVIVFVVGALACREDPERARIRQTSKGTYDPKTGRLSEITYDKNKDGRIDTWVSMDGSRPVSARLDTDEDGTIDRWEYYNQNGLLLRVGESRAKTGQADMYAYMGADGTPARIEFLELSNVTSQEGVVRREYLEAGVKVRGEEDTDGDGVMDRWEIFSGGRLRSVEFDDAKKRDGKPTQRLTYDDRGALVSIESDPDGQGGYRQKRVIKN